MPKREIIVRLEDARQLIVEIEVILIEVKTFERYSTSRLYQLALERAFELIGESLFQIRKEREDVAISDLNKIIGLRHLIIAHEYYEVEHERLWSFATKHLQLLKKEIITLIDEENLKLFGTINPQLD
jgi:uncharacterized protein with HEPN domain